MNSVFNSYRIEKRYNDFILLHENLTKQIDKKHLPELPGNKFFYLI